MSESKSLSVLTINFRPPALRWVLLLPALLALLGASLAVRWYVGNTIAEFSPTASEDSIEMARLAVRWAPGDPLTHWRMATMEQKTLSTANLARAVREYELAVMASPYDYRYWMELGRALEAAGDPDSGEKALRRAVELAPAYSYPRWFYGNLLVRQGKFDEAFAQLALAAEADDIMQPQIFALTLQLYGNDIEKITQAFKSARVRTQFTVHLINTGKFDEGLRVLRTIGPVDRKAQSTLINQAVEGLVVNKQFQAALILIHELEPGAMLPEKNQFWNGGFSDSVLLADTRPFRWVIVTRPQAEITIDPNGHASKGALRVIFKASNNLETIPISQTIVVEPNVQYRIQYYQRTERLRSGSTPFINVYDAKDGSALAASQPLPSGTNDWQPVTLEFKTKPTAEAISLAVMRNACEGNQPICPIFGTVWYDDFNLQRLNGSGTAARSAADNNR